MEEIRQVRKNDLQMSYGPYYYLYWKERNSSNGVVIYFKDIGSKNSRLSKSPKLLAHDLQYILDMNDSCSTTFSLSVLSPCIQVYSGGDPVTLCATSPSEEFSNDNHDYIGNIEEEILSVIPLI